MAADDVRLSGINWREAFPFTHLFRSFRIAVHPSKLALGLIALVCLYLGGRVLDAVWPEHHLAVDNEPLLYDEFGAGQSFRARRAELRDQIEENYAYQLVNWDIEKDFPTARRLARGGERTDEYETRVIARRDKTVADANGARDRQ